MHDPLPQTIYLRDYTPPPFLVDTVDLDIAIHDDHALVTAHLAVRRNPASSGSFPLVLDRDEVELVSMQVNGTALTEADYTATDEHVTLKQVPDKFELRTICRIHPHTNTKLMGLYASKDGFFTQCEAQGFRRITCFPDRPDVMARFTTTISADKTRYPVLLSNGNPHSSGDAENGHHWARWVDPFPKPSYLFAMVAAKLDVVRDSFVTRSGRTAQLAIFVEPGKLDQSAWAMLALKKAMKWDEDVFGLELDLDHYMIVAVGDFNMGAMENKGLNIFNTKYVLARADTATDTDFMNIDRVVAHEYFHNWTGNRVTCRDWFQLSLKEGLTVFRDQEFGSDLYSRAVQRIQEVRGLRAAQFPEDAGPMAHPVRPGSYMEISNFYTATVYEKGAEVVRMIHTLIGAAGFRKGMDLYFQRHDGQAVTTDDFVQAMQDASGTDLFLFRRWYEQAGTPRLQAKGSYDGTRRTYTLDLEQSCPATPGQANKQALHVPVAVGLVGPDGSDIPLQLEGEARAQGTTRILSLREDRKRFTFVNVAEAPVPSLLRQFSAPIILENDYSDEDLMHLLAHDSDTFNRWEAGQRLATGLLLKGVEAVRSGKVIQVPRAFFDAFSRVLEDGSKDPAFAAEVLSLPSEAFLAEQMEVVDPDAIHFARNQLRHALAQTLREQWHKVRESLHEAGPYQPEPRAMGRRALRNLCMSYLMETGDAAIRSQCLIDFRRADNMTDAQAALAALAQYDIPERSEALQLFHTQWKDEALVLDKWFAVQATSRLSGTLDHVTKLLVHPSFDIRNPNKVRSLIGAFCMSNHVRFHSCGRARLCLRRGADHPAGRSQSAGGRAACPQFRSLEKIRRRTPALCPRRPGESTGRPRSLQGRG